MCGDECVANEKRPAPAEAAGMTGQGAPAEAEQSAEEWLYSRSVRLLEDMKERAKTAPSRELSCAITKLEECVMWQERTGFVRPPAPV